MVKFVAHTEHGPLIGFGLIAENVKRPKQGQPIKIDLASMGLPVRWVSIRGILRLLVRIVRETFRALFSLVGWVFRLIQRRRSARPLPHYTTIRPSAFDQSDEE